MPVSAEGRVENQKLNQTAALLLFGWVFGFQLDSLENEFPIWREKPCTHILAIFPKKCQKSGFNRTHPLTNIRGFGAKLYPFFYRWFFSASVLQAIFFGFCTTGDLSKRYRFFLLFLAYLRSLTYAKGSLTFFPSSNQEELRQIEKLFFFSFQTIQCKSFSILAAHFQSTLINVEVWFRVLVEVWYEGR